jgi:hypothetical protein
MSKPLFCAAIAAGAAFSLGCATPALESRRDPKAPAILALQKGSFAEAEQLAAGKGDPDSRLVRAIVRHQKTNRRLWRDGRIIAGGLAMGAIDDRHLHTTLADAESQLAEVEEDLAAVAAQPGLALDLCIACWEVDWNGDGVVDERDRRLLEIERDEHGERLPEGDPRRRPTFRFDDGDVAWARAFVSFERAALDVVLAYDWSELATLSARRRDRHAKVVVRLVEPQRIAQAKERILGGLDQSDAARRAYLAETDDEREWVPSPRQRSHPMPLAVNQALYDTWEGVVGDVRRLVNGEEGLSIAAVFSLAGEDGAPGGYLDIGRMLREPRDLVIDLDAIRRGARHRGDEGALRGLLGDYYVEKMRPSPLTGRLARMKGEIDRREEDLGRKLRYLVWLN